MNKRTTRWAIGGLVAMTLLAAACGSDDKSSDTAAPTTAASATTAGSATTAASATTAGGATTTAGSATTAKPATTAAGSAAGTTPAKAKGTLQGSGSTLQLAYQQEAIDAFQKANSGATITYGGGGSGKGRTDLKNKTVDFAGSDSPSPMPTSRPSEILYFPILSAPITVSYNLSGVDKLQLSADTIAKIFQRQIKSGTTRPSPLTTRASRCRRRTSSSPTAPMARARHRTSLSGWPRRRRRRGR